MTSRAPRNPYGRAGSLHVESWPVRHALGLAFGGDVCAWIQEVNDARGKRAHVAGDEVGSRGPGQRQRRDSGQEKDLWEEVCSVLEAMGLENWVWSRILNECRSEAGRTLPGSVAMRLQSRHLSVTAQNLILLDSLDEFLEQTNKREIPVLALKGAALLSGPFQVYQDIGARSMSDLDIFCGPQGIEEASGVAQELGYKITQSPLDARGLGHHRYFSKFHPATLGRGEEGSGVTVTLELHYRLTVWWWFMGALDGMAAGNLAAWEPGDRGFASPGQGMRQTPWPELLLIHLCLHMVKHGMGPDLRNVVDIRELSRQHVIDWDRLEAMAHQAGVWPLVAFVLTWIQDALLAPVGETGPWHRQMGRLASRDQPRLGRLISRTRIPPLGEIPVPLPLSSSGRWILDPHSSIVLGYLALLPGPRAKMASLTWWFWDRWDLRRLLRGKGR